VAEFAAFDDVASPCERVGETPSGAVRRPSALLQKDQPRDVVGWTPPAFRPRWAVNRGREAWRFELVAIELGKQSFQLRGVSGGGVVLSRKVSRAKLFAVVGHRDGGPPQRALWGRRFQEAGCQMRLIHPRFVKAFVRGAKNDAVDAEAIYEAGGRPTMRFVPGKNDGSVQAVHRIRKRLVCHRTALINCSSSYSI
jgi:hypothetical protein